MFLLTDTVLSAGFKFNNSEFDLKVVRLCFQVFLPDERGKITVIVPPVVSQSIWDESKFDLVYFLPKEHLTLTLIISKTVSENCLF